MLDGAVIAERLLAAPSHHHGLGVSIKLLRHMAAEVLDDHLDLLGDGRGVQLGESRHLALRRTPLELWFVLNGLLKCIVRLVGHVVLQHVEDEALLNRLTHGVEVEWLGQSVCPLGPEALQRNVARGRREREVGDVLLWASLALVSGDDLLKCIGRQFFLFFPCEGLRQRLG